MPDHTAHQGLERLRNIWRYDPAMGKRIDEDLEAFERYVEVRSAHVALSHAPASEYDSDAVKAADKRRTRAHNEAIRRRKTSTAAASSLAQIPSHQRAPQVLSSRARHIAMPWRTSWLTCSNSRTISAVVST